MIISQRVLSNVGFGNDVGIWEGSIVYEVLYLVFEVKVIVGVVARFFVIVAIVIEISRRRYGIRHGCGV